MGWIPCPAHYLCGSNLLIFLENSSYLENVFILGASSGIGSAAAEFFAQKGYMLSLNGRNASALKETVKQCLSKGLTEDSVSNHLLFMQYA